MQSHCFGANSLVIIRYRQYVLIQIDFFQVAASATVLPGEAIAALVEASPLKEAVARVVVIDGAVASQLSDTERLPQEVRCGRD